MPTKLKLTPPPEDTPRQKTLIRVPPQLTPIPGTEPVKNPSSNQWLRNALLGANQGDSNNPPKHKWATPTTDLDPPTAPPWADTKGVQPDDGWSGPTQPAWADSKGVPSHDGWAPPTQPKWADTKGIDPNIANKQTAQPTRTLIKVSKDNPIGAEMQVLYKNNLPYDNKPAIDVVKSAAAKTGVNPSLLFSSAFQEGLNKSIAKPDNASGGYINAGNGVYDNEKGVKGQQDKLDTKNYPVDGFGNFGLDTFSDRYPELVKKGYLPNNFDFKPFKAYNEQNQLVNTAAFRNNESALMAKAAMLKDSTDQINSLAKNKGINLDDKARNYFTLAAYNGGLGNAKKMMDEYSQAKDKNAFIDQGQTSRKGVHKNISVRMKNMQLANQLLTQ